MQRFFDTLTELSATPSVREGRHVVTSTTNSTDLDFDPIKKPSGRLRNRWANCSRLTKELKYDTEEESEAERQTSPEEARPIEFAQRYLTCGFSVVPIVCDGSKRPNIRWKDLQTKQLSQTEINTHFDPSAGNVGIGPRHGLRRA